MAHARQVQRGLPGTVLYLIAALTAAVVVATTVAFSMLGPLRLDGPAVGELRVDPAVMEAARQWELERRQQSGWIDPVIDAGRDWERQRKQQSPSY